MFVSFFSKKLLECSAHVVSTPRLHLVNNFYLKSSWCFVPSYVTGFQRVISSTTKPLLMPLDEFRDPVSRQKRQAEKVGRPWSVTELRLKSFEDLHKLWIVLYKERNMLLTEQQLSRRRSIPFPQPERIKKVRKSMGAIKQVLGERKRDHLSQLALRRLNAVEDDVDDDDEEPEVKQG